MIGEPAQYRTRYEDTLLEVARRFGLGYVEMMAANPTLDPWLPGEGTKVSLPTRHLLPDAPRKGIVVNLGDMRLYHFHSDGTVRSYPIGIGRQGAHTPLGHTTITLKREAPTWIPPASIRKEKPDLPAAIGRARTIRSATMRSISAGRPMSFTAPTGPTGSAAASATAASACIRKTSRTCSRMSRWARR